MNKKLVVSGENAVRMYTWPDGKLMKMSDLFGAGAICTAEGHLYCAGDEGVIWRLDLRTFLPTGMFAGGPNVIRMIAQDKRIYLLCMDGNSMMMINLETQQPIRLVKTGSAPLDMCMSSDGRRIAVAGGRNGRAELFDADTLIQEDFLHVGDYVCGAAFAGRTFAAIGVRDGKGILEQKKRKRSAERYPLHALPISMTVDRNYFAVGLENEIRFYGENGVLYQSETTPGPVMKYIANHEGECIVEGISGNLYIRETEGLWKRLCTNIRDALVL